MNISFIKSNQKKEITEKLKEIYGISNLPYLLIESGKEKIRAFSGSLSKEEILEISEIAKIEVVGGYLMRQEGVDDLRLSFDAPLILQEQITKAIVEIDKDQFELWIRGNDIEIKAEKGNVILKYNGDFVGCGKSNGLKIFNYVPKDRRLKTTIKSQ
jgi:NOL1/NOP2/fmu family ribosome biogenesis protein